MADYALLPQFAWIFLWGGVVLLSFTGWGWLAQRLLTGHPPAADWGLAAGWGMAAATVFGGVTALVHLVSAVTIIVFVIAGALYGAVVLWRQRMPAPTVAPGLRWALALAAIGLLARYAAHIHYEAMSCTDDYVAYFAYVERLLQTGTLIEPFGWRRLAAYGGHTYLQALIVAVGTIENAYLVDRGLSVVVWFGLILGHFRNAGPLRPLHVVVTALITVVIPVPVMNSASHVTGIVLLVTLYRTLSPLNDRPAFSGANLWLVALAVAGAATLRPQFAVAAALTVAIYWLLARPAPVDWRRYGLALIKAGALSALLVLPWVVLLQISSGSPFYPLIAGNHQPAFAVFEADIGFAGKMAFLWAFLADPRVALYLAPLAAVLLRRRQKAATALYLASAATAVITALSFTSLDVDGLHRYAAPLLTAAFSVALAGLIAEILPAGPPADPGLRRVARIGDVALWVLLLALMPGTLWRDADRLRERWNHRIAGDALHAAYGDMQAAVPAGQGMLVALDHPFLLDCRRNSIFDVDIPGVASPDPGMPYFEGPATLVEYLKSLDIGFIAYRDFSVPSGCLYRRDMWHKHLQGGTALWREHARYYLDLMDTLESLAAGQSTRYAAHGLRVISLP